jgi:hypothetical protein
MRKLVVNELREAHVRQWNKRPGPVRYKPRRAYKVGGICKLCGEPVPGPKGSCPCLSPIELRDRVYQAYGGSRCNCCGESNPGFLTIDHVNNDGAKFRKKHGTGVQLYKWVILNNFPPIFQILCMNCNWGKRRAPYICPHKRANVN